MRYLILMVLATVQVCGGCSDDTESLKCNLGEYSGDFEINTQSDVETLAGYTEITGSIEIDCTSCTDLNELSCLTSVGENLFFLNIPDVTNLDGLDALTSVGGTLLIGVDNGDTEVELPGFCGHLTCAG